jgi:hypothetical protein
LANQRVADQPDAGAIIPGFTQLAREAAGQENTEIRKPDRYRVQRKKQDFKTRRRKINRGTKKYSRRK